MNTTEQNKDPLTAFREAQRALLDEKLKLETRLAEISQLLAGQAPNPMSLDNAIQKVLFKGPATKKEIMGGVIGLGYRFVTAKPLNSLNVLLYSGRYPRDGEKFCMPTKELALLPKRKKKKKVQ